MTLAFVLHSLCPQQIALQVIRGDLVCVWEESVEEWIFVGIEAWWFSIVEVLYVFVVAQHADCDLFESAPLVNLEEIRKLLINFEPYLAVSVYVIDRQNFVCTYASCTIWFSLAFRNILGYTEAWSKMIFVVLRNWLR